MFRTIIRTMLGVFVAGLVTTAAQAQTYPEQPIKIIVPAGAGGSSDSAARFLAPALEEILGQPIVIVNVPGGGQVIGNRQAKEAKPDGYTLTLTHVAMHIAQALGRADFGIESFKPVTQIMRSGLVLAVRADAPWQTFEEFVEDARSRPGELLAGANIGAFNHFGEIILGNEIGAKFRYVQTGGSAKTVAAVIGGHVNFSATPAADVAQYVESGDLRVLVQLQDERDPLFPDVRTVAEAGYSKAKLYANFYLLAPAATPVDRIDTLSNAVSEALGREDVLEKFSKRGFNVAYRPASEALEADINQENQAVIGAAKTYSSEK